MIGTFVIAAIGYGFAILFAVGAMLNAKDAFDATGPKRDAATSNMIMAAIVALVFAAVTRWLLGGAL